MMRFLQTFTSQPTATNTRKSGLILDLQLKERELKSLKGTIITNDTPGFKRFVDTLDCILIDGLKDMRAAYWPVMHPLLCKSTLTELCSLQRVRTPLGRSRAWLFRGFSDQLLFSYLNCLVEDRSTIEQFYSRDAILYNKINLLEVVTIVGAVERDGYSFDLQTDCTYFDNVNWLRNEAPENDAEVARDASESVDLTEQVEIRCETLDQHVTYHSEDHNQENDSLVPSSTAVLSSASETTDAQPCSQIGSAAKIDSSWVNSLDRKEHRTYSDPPIIANPELDLLNRAENAPDTAAPLHHRTASQTDCTANNRSGAGEWGAAEMDLGAANRDVVSITSSDNLSSVDESAEASAGCVTTVKSRVRGVRNRKRVETDHVDTRSSSPTPVLATPSEPVISEVDKRVSVSEPEPSTPLTASSEQTGALPESDPVDSDAATVEQTDVEPETTEAEKLDEPLIAVNHQEYNDEETNCNVTESQSSFSQSANDKCSGTKPRDTQSYSTELPHEAKLLLELSVFTQNERCERVFNVLSSFMDGDVQPSWLVFTNRHVMSIDKLHRGIPVDFSNQRNITFSSLPLAEVQCINSGLHEQWLSIVTKRRRVALMLDTASRSLTAAIASTLLSLQSSVQCYSDASVFELVLRKHACRDCDCLSLSSHDPATAQCRIISSHLCFLTQLTPTSPHIRTSSQEQTDVKANKRGLLEWRKFYVDANQAADVRSGGSSMWNAMAYSHALMQGALDTVRNNPAQLVRSLKSGLTGTLSGLRRLAGAGAERMKGPRSDSSRNSHSDASSDTSDFTMVEQDWNSGHFVLEHGLLSHFASESAAQCDFSYSVAEHCIGCQIGTHSEDPDFEGEAAGANTKMSCLLLFREESGMLVDATHNSVSGQVVCLEIRVGGGFSDAIRDWHSACCRTVLAGQSGLLNTGQRAATNVQRNTTACALLLAAHCDGTLRMHFVRGNRVLHDYRTLSVVDLNGTTKETALLVVGNDHLVINQSSSEEPIESPLSIVSFTDSAELTKFLEIAREFEQTKPNDRLNVSCLERVNQDTLADIHPALSCETINLINEHIKKYVTVP